MDLTYEEIKRAEAAHALEEEKAAFGQNYHGDGDWEAAWRVAQAVKQSEAQREAHPTPPKLNKGQHAYVLAALNGAIESSSRLRSFVEPLSAAERADLIAQATEGLDCPASVRDAIEAACSRAVATVIDTGDVGRAREDVRREALAIVGQAPRTWAAPSGIPTAEESAATLASIPRA